MDILNNISASNCVEIVTEINLEQSEDEDLYSPAEKSISSNVLGTNASSDLKQVTEIDLQSIEDEDEFLYGNSNTPPTELKTLAEKNDSLFKSSWSDDDEVELNNFQQHTTKVSESKFSELKTEHTLNRKILDCSLVIKDNNAVPNLSLTLDAKKAINKFINDRIAVPIFSNQVKMGAEKKAKDSSINTIWSEDEYETDFSKIKSGCDEGDSGKKSSPIKVCGSEVIGGILKKTLVPNKKLSLLNKTQPNDVKEVSDKIVNESTVASAKEKAVCGNRLLDKNKIQPTSSSKLESKWVTEDEPECNTSALLNAIISSKHFNHPAKVANLISYKDSSDSGQSLVDNFEKVYQDKNILLDKNVKTKFQPALSSELESKWEKEDAPECNTSSLLNAKISSKQFNQPEKIANLIPHRDSSDSGQSILDNFEDRRNSDSKTPVYVDQKFYDSDSTTFIEDDFSPIAEGPHIPLKKLKNEGDYFKSDKLSKFVKDAPKSYAVDSSRKNKAHSKEESDKKTFLKDKNYLGKKLDHKKQYEYDSEEKKSCMSSRTQKPHSRSCKRKQITHYSYRQSFYEEQDYLCKKEKDTLCSKDRSPRSHSRDRYSISPLRTRNYRHSISPHRKNCRRRGISPHRKKYRRHSISPLREKSSRYSFSPRNDRHGFSPLRRSGNRRSFSPRNERHSLSPLRKKYSRWRSRSPEYHRSSYSSRYCRERSPYNYSYNKKITLFDSSDSTSLSDLSLSSLESLKNKVRDKPNSKAKKQSLKKRKRKEESTAFKKYDVKDSSSLNGKVKQDSKLPNSSKLRKDDFRSNLLNSQLMHKEKETEKVEIIKNQKTANEQNKNKKTKKAQNEIHPNLGSPLSYSQELTPQKCIPTSTSWFPESLTSNNSYSLHQSAFYYNVPSYEYLSWHGDPTNSYSYDHAYHNFSLVNNSSFSPTADNYSASRECNLKQVPVFDVPMHAASANNNLVQISTESFEKDENCAKFCRKKCKMTVSPKSYAKRATVILESPLSPTIEKAKSSLEGTNAENLEDCLTVNEITPKSSESDTNSSLTRQLISISLKKRPTAISHKEQNNDATNDFTKKSYKEYSIDKHVLEKALGSTSRDIGEVRSILQNIENKESTSKNNNNLMTICRKFIDGAEREQKLIIENMHHKAKDLNDLEGKLKKEDLKILQEEIKGQINEGLSCNIPNTMKFAAFDPKHHWCELCCKEFPTAGHILTHFYSSEHLKHVDPCRPMTFQETGKIDIGSDCILKPMKGVEFVKPHHSFYCSLCKESLLSKSHAHQHLKGHTHTVNYLHYMKENPTYEKKREMMKTISVYKNLIMKKDDVKKKTLNVVVESKQGQVQVNRERAFEKRGKYASTNLSNSVKKLPRKAITIGRIPSYKHRLKFDKKYLFQKTKVDNRVSLMEKTTQNKEICEDIKEKQLIKNSEFLEEFGYNNISLKGNTEKEGSVLEELTPNTLLDKSNKADNEDMLINENTLNNEICGSTSKNSLQNKKENSSSILEKPTIIETSFDEKTEAYKETLLNKENIQLNESCTNSQENKLLKIQENNNTNASECMVINFYTDEEIETSIECMAINFHTDGEIVSSIAEISKADSSSESDKIQKVILTPNTLLDKYTKSDNEDMLINENTQNNRICGSTPENNLQNKKENSSSFSEKPAITTSFDEKTEAYNETLLNNENMQLNKSCTNSQENELLKTLETTNTNASECMVINSHADEEIETSIAEISKADSSSESDKIQKVIPTYFPSASEEKNLECKQMSEFNKTQRNNNIKTSKCGVIDLHTDEGCKTSIAELSKADSSSESDKIQMMISDCIPSTSEEIISKYKQVSEFNKSKEEENADHILQSDKPVMESNAHLQPSTHNLLKGNSSACILQIKPIAAYKATPSINNNCANNNYVNPICINCFCGNCENQKFTDIDIVPKTGFQLDVNSKDGDSKKEHNILDNLLEEELDSDILLTVKSNITEEEDVNQTSHSPQLSENQTLKDSDSFENSEEMEKLLGCCREFSICLTDISLASETKDVEMKNPPHNFDWKKRKAPKKKSMLYYPPHYKGVGLRSENEVKNYCKMQKIAFPHYLFLAKQR